MLVTPESSSTVLAMMSSKSVSICNHFHARWANSSKIRFSKGGTPLWCPRSRGISSPSDTKLSRKKLETLGYHTVKTRTPGVSISSGLESVPGRDRQTDRIPIANTLSQQYLPVLLWHVKTGCDYDLNGYQRWIISSACIHWIYCIVAIQLLFTFTVVFLHVTAHSTMNVLVIVISSIHLSWPKPSPSKIETPGVRLPYAIVTSLYLNLS